MYITARLQLDQSLDIGMCSRDAIGMMGPIWLPMSYGAYSIKLVFRMDSSRSKGQGFESHSTSV